MHPVPRDKIFFNQAKNCTGYAVVLLLLQIVLIVSPFIGTFISVELSGMAFLQMTFGLVAFSVVAGLAKSMGQLTRHNEKRFEELTAEIQRLSAGSAVTEPFPSKTV